MCSCRYFYISITYPSPMILTVHLMHGALYLIDLFILKIKKGKGTVSLPSNLNPPIPI